MSDELIEKARGEISSRWKEIDMIFVKYNASLADRRKVFFLTNEAANGVETVIRAITNQNDL